MSVELVVITICALQGDCTQATRAWYAQSVEAQHISNGVQKIAEDEFGKENLATMGTVAGIIFIKEGNFNVTKNCDVVIGQTSKIQLHWEY